MTSQLQVYANEVVAAVCERYGIKPKDLLAQVQRNRVPWGRYARRTSGNRHTRYKSKPYAAARTDAVRILRGTVAHDEVIEPSGIPALWVPLSYPAIGRLLGGLHHATCILAQRRGETPTTTMDEYLNERAD